MSRLANQLTETVRELRAAGARFALIGGLALAAHKVVRGTQDIDLLVDGDQSDHIDALLKRLGYQSIHSSVDAANYLRGSERVDLLYAIRPTARLLLARTGLHETVLGDIPVISCEGLIAFKLQAIVNNPARTQDLEDMRALLHANRADLDMDELRAISGSSTARRCSMNSWPDRDCTPLARDAGLEQSVVDHRDAYLRLVELMEVLEALCPVWPDRPTFPADAIMRL